MSSILYIGNKLKKQNVASISALGFFLEKEGFIINYASCEPNKILRLCDMLWSCFKFRNEVDYVLIDTYSTQNFYYAFFVSQLCRVLNLKYIPILHGGNLPKRLQNNPRLSGLLFKNAYKNVAPSLYLKTIFEAYGYKNIVHIPNTIEINNYPFEKREFKNIRLLWVRSFSEIYNPELAVKVLKILKEEGFDASLTMVGPDADGSLKNVRSLADSLDVRVVFTGKLPKKEWIELSKSHNIFINTTNFDNMPVSVIEAMALGLPVVSTNVGGMPYLIEDKVDGVLVNPNSVSEFVSAIKKLLQDTNETYEMAKKARRKVENFDWSVVKAKWFSVLS